MRADQLFYSATLACGVLLFQSAELSAVMQPPVNPQPAEKTPQPSVSAESAQEPKAGLEEQKEKSDRPEDVVEQESHKSPDSPDASGEAVEQSEEHTPLTEQQLADSKSILGTSERFVDAYAKGDAELAAAQFTDDAEYVDEYGNVYRGRTEIQKLLKDYFQEHPSCQLELDVDSIRFIGAGVAIEDGETTLTHRDHGHVAGDASETAAPHSSSPKDDASSPDKRSDDQNPAPKATTTGKAAESPNATADEKTAQQPSIDSGAIDPSMLQEADAKHDDSRSAIVRCRYSAVYTNIDGKWLVASIRDFPHEERRDHHAHLESLNWLLGDWIDESEYSLVHFSCEPADNGNYLIRTFSIVIDGEESLSGTQRIGWCPVTGKLRAWIFDSEGGYADGFWHRDGDDWVLKCTGVTADGETASYTSVYRILNDHTTSWQYIDYEIDGVSQPDSEVFTIVQRPPTPTPAVAGGDQ